MKILLAQRRALGDTVLLTSTIENLARAVPGAEIHALVPGAYAPVLEGNPHLRAIYHFEENWLSLLPKLRRERFDHFVQLHFSPRNRWLARFSGAREVHLSVQNNEVAAGYGRQPNALEWDSFFLRSRFASSLALPGPAPRIYLSEQERAEGAATWRALGADPAGLVFFGLGASRPTKRWPAAHFAELAELLRDRYELRPAIVVGPGEAEARFGGEVLDAMRARGLRAIGSGGKGDFVHTSNLGVRKLAGALSSVRAYVGNDSGPKHIAVAVGIPTFTFFGPEDPQEWHPYSREEHPVFFLPGLSCRAEDQGRWCGIETCTVERHRCLRDLEPLDVIQSIGKALS